jgi:hypothetical protein
MTNLSAGALEQIRARVLSIRDGLVLKLIEGKKITATDALRINNELNRFRAEEVADEMTELLSRWKVWSFMRGVEQIDRALAGMGLQKTMRLSPATGYLADETVRRLEGYFPEGTKIVTIVPELVKSLKAHVLLSMSGARTPTETWLGIMRATDATMTQAERIVRTELHMMREEGAEQRIREATTRARQMKIPMVRYWIHSSGMATPAGKPVQGSRRRAGFAKGKARQGYAPRPHHKAMHGVAVPLDGRFTLTNQRTGETWEIDGPHDRALPASEVINCYCTRSIRIDRSALNTRTRAKVEEAERRRARLLSEAYERMRIIEGDCGRVERVEE